jgi:HK97 family phage major capsid protein
MSKLVELREEIAAKSAELAQIFEQSRTADGTYDLRMADALKSLADGQARADEIKRRNDELTELGKQRDEIARVEDIAQRAKQTSEEYNKPGSGMRFPGAADGSAGAKAPRRSLETILRESKSYQAFREGHAKSATFDLTLAEFKTLITLGDINNPPTRLPNIVESAQETATVRDWMLSGTTDNNAITYIEETTFTNAAAAVDEGAAKPESALAFTERTDNVRKIATWIPATSELLSDVKGFQSYLEGRLRFMVKRTEEVQLLVGDGTAPNISGILDRSGIQTQAKGADPTPDAVYKAMTKIMSVGFADPTGVVFHPNDWQDIRLLRTADGIYIWGSPADIGPDRIWGLPVRKTTAMTENTALVGAFTPYAQVFEREGVTVTISTEHSTYFVENKVAVLAEERLALAVYRPSAFCTVTGI